MSNQFEIMIKKLTPTLRRITHKLNGHFTFFSDEDLFQEALVHLWVSYQNGILDGKTDSYILQGCYFYLKNYLRVTIDKAKVLSLYQLMGEDNVSLEEMLAAEDRVIYDNIDQKLLMENASSSGMTEKEKEILSLCLDGFTTREIGQKTGISHVMVIKIKNKIKDKWHGRLPG